MKFACLYIRTPKACVSNFIVLYLQISKFDTYAFGVRIGALCAATAITLETPPAHSNKLLQPAQATMQRMTISDLKSQNKFNVLIKQKGFE